MKLYPEFAKKWPVEYSEDMIIDQIHIAIECAKKYHKESEDEAEYLKYLSKSYSMLEDFFNEKGINPASYV